MTRYQNGDIECTAIQASGSTYCAQVRIAAHCFTPALASDYIYTSEVTFEDRIDALRYAMNHANENFPPGGAEPV